MYNCKQTADSAKLILLQVYKYNKYSHIPTTETKTFTHSLAISIKNIFAFYIPLR